MQFWPILGPYDPLKSPSHYQQSILNGSYSPKSLHKLVLTENVFIFIFYDVKVYQMFLKVVYRVILTNFRTLSPTQKPLILPRKNVKGLIFSQILYKIVLPEKRVISIVFGVKMTEKCPKYHISCNFGQFWDHMTHSKASYTTKKYLDVLIFSKKSP